MIQRTDIGNSPLLKLVKERDYTRSMDFGKQPGDDGAAKPEKPAGASPEPEKTENPAQGAGPGPGSQETSGGGQKFNIPNPGDTTKEFQFNEEAAGPSDVNDDDHGEGVGISGASAKSFANFAGDAIQMYLPKLAYNYCKVDMENIIVNIQKGILTMNWQGIFETVNKHTEEALVISDDAIKMWKKACKDYLESENISFANPKTAFLLATVVLLLDMGVKAWQIRKSNEDLVKQAIDASNPGKVYQQQDLNQPAQPAAAEKPSKESINGTGSDRIAA